MEQIERLCQGGVDRIILREKDLSEELYEQLAQKVMNICVQYQTECVLHTFPGVARRLHTDKIHLPLPVARELLTDCQRDTRNRQFAEIGISIHSLREAEQAEALGATYLTAGHIFVTTCKRGVAPRGPEFLREICENILVPVYAIGGICEENIREVMECKAAGICVMSQFMNASVKEIAHFKSTFQKCILR